MIRVYHHIKNIYEPYGHLLSKEAGKADVGLLQGYCLASFSPLVASYDTHGINWSYVTS